MATRCREVPLPGAYANDGQTLLHTAAYTGRLDVVKYLCEEREANKEVASNDGKTPLHCAAAQGHLNGDRHGLECAREQRGELPTCCPPQGQAGPGEGRATVSVQAMGCCGTRAEPRSINGPPSNLDDYALAAHRKCSLGRFRLQMAFFFLFGVTKWVKKGIRTSYLFEVQYY